MRYFVYILTSNHQPHTPTMWMCFSKSEMERTLRESIESIPDGLTATITVRTAGKRWHEPLRVIQVDANHSVHIKTKPRH